MFVRKNKYMYICTAVGHLRPPEWCKRPETARKPAIARKRLDTAADTTAGHCGHNHRKTSGGLRKKAAAVAYI